VETPVVRLLLADDHALFRAGLRALLQPLSGYQIVAEASDGEEALGLCRDLRPDIAVLDIGLPNLTGLDVAERLRNEGSTVRVLLVSAHCDEEYVRQALRLEVAGYLSKDSTTEELEVALRAVGRGATFLSPTVSQQVVRDYVRQIDASPPELTPRQRDVVRLVAEGLSTKEIAFRLALSVKTVETHRGQIMQRLGVDSVAALTRYAVRMGIVSR
jgi:DNA-binding NarL/FixJ family response regulator